MSLYLDRRDLVFCVLTVDLSIAHSINIDMRSARTTMLSASSQTAA